MTGRLLTFLTGVVFALGLGISEMTRPEKILAFLDLPGDWDPSLLFVMASGVAVYLCFQRLIRKYYTPFCAADYTLPKEKKVDRKLLAGAAIFGLGWGLLGLCPGPAITIITTLKPELFLFLISVGVGQYVASRPLWS